MVAIRRIYDFIPPVIDVEIMVREHVRQVDVTQGITLYRIVHSPIHTFPYPSRYGELRMVTSPIVKSSVQQQGDDILTIKIQAHINRAIWFFLYRKHQILLPLTDQFIAHIRVKICTDHDRHGFLQFLHGKQAILFQAADLRQPFLITRIYTFKQDTPDMKRIGRGYRIGMY